jgi:AraC-like DNA-binding protein
MALRERLLNCGDLSARFDRVQSWLLQRWQAHRRLDPTIARLLHQIEHSGGQLRIEQTARTLGVSRKHLSLRCLQQTGQTPKALARVSRFRAAIELLGSRQQVPWAQLAHCCGYADQAHLIRDFRHFSGLTPNDFIKHGRPDPGSIVIR